MTPQTIFFNEHGRLRSGWRVSFFLLSFAIFVISLSAGFVALLSALPAGAGQNSLLTMIGSFVIFAFSAVFLGWFCGKTFEGLPFRALGIWRTKNWLKNLFLGLLVGAGSILLAALIPFAAGAISFQANSSAGYSPLLLTLGVTLVIFTAGSVAEETLFRGYMLQTLARAGLLSFGMLITSVLFASVHADNEGSNYFSLFNTFVAGIWFSVAYWKTRDLWFPIGIHLAWNWVQGSVLGINVSGISTLANAPLLRSEDFGPVWLTGGGYGLEGGIACTIALVISTAAIWFLPFPKPAEEMTEMTGGENNAVRDR